MMEIGEAEDARASRAKPNREAPFRERAHVPYRL